jgi:FkbM family methyltransferase
MIFVDVGSHRGEVLPEVLKPIYTFSEVFCIEPSTLGQKSLSRYLDRRIRVMPWAAWSADGEMVLHSAGSVGGSLFPDKKQEKTTTEIVETRNFGQWLEENYLEREIFIKINVEGAEYEILKSLLGKRCTSYIKAILLSFDMPKVPSLGTKQDEFLEFIRRIALPVATRANRDPVEAVREWLVAELPYSNRARLSDWVKYYRELPKFRVVRQFSKPFVPRKMWLYLAQKFGPDRL